MPVFRILWCYKMLVLYASLPRFLGVTECYCMTVSHIFSCYILLVLHGSLPDVLVLDILGIACQSSAFSFTDHRNNNRQVQWVTDLEALQNFYLNAEKFFFQTLKIYVILEACIMSNFVVVVLSLNISGRGLICLNRNFEKWWNFGNCSNVKWP